MEMVKTMKIRERGCKDAQVRGRQKINERRENRNNKVKHYENPNINAKERVYEEKKRKGPEAKLKRLRNQKLKLPEERELLDKYDGLATAAGTTESHTHTHLNPESRKGCLQKEEPGHVGA